MSYLKDQEDIVRNMTLERHKELANKYINPEKMIYVVSGDAASQLDKLKSAGFDEVYLLDKEGNPKELSKELEPVL